MIVVGQGGRWGGESHICCSGCCMANRREDSDSLHVVALHCWGSQVGFMGLHHWQTSKLSI